MIVKNSYIARNGDGDGPSTPWGPAQFSYILHRGVVFYSTAGHGGMRVSERIAEKYMTEYSRSHCIHCWQYQSCELPDFAEYWQSQMVNTLDNICCMELLKACNRETYDNYILNSSETRKLPCYCDSEIWGD